MLQANSDRVMSLLSESDKVLDIGGWAHPFNRANYVMDAGSYRTRGYYNRTFAQNNPFPPIGGTREYFTEATWIERDICERTPYPFKDKELDYVVCSHTLEDLRDPLWVCAEMIRIAKRGYLEVPSRIWESCRGMEPGITGLSHHRWLVEIDGNRVTFVQKFHRIHNWQYSLPSSVLKGLTAEQSVTWLFWENSFEFQEIFLHGEQQLNYLRDFVDQTKPYPRSWLQAWRVGGRVAAFPGRATRAVFRRLPKSC